MSARYISDLTVRDNFKNAKLLIIEDNPDQRMLIESAIRRSLPEVNYVLTTTEDEAVMYLNQCSQAEWEMPKLILLDLYLPTREIGWRLLDYIKSMSSALSKIPVVLLSASSARADITEAYQRGCSSYLVKPSQFADWLNYFQTLRTYWWETATLPKAGISLF